MDEFSLRERSEVLLKESVLKDEGIGWMSLEKDWDPFLKDFCLNIDSRLSSFLQESSFFGAITFPGTKKRSYANLHDGAIFAEDGSLKKVRWSDVILEDGLEEDFSKEEDLISNEDLIPQDS